MDLHSLNDPKYLGQGIKTKIMYRSRSFKMASVSVKTAAPHEY